MVFMLLKNYIHKCQWNGHGSSRKNDSITSCQASDSYANKTVNHCDGAKESVLGTWMAFHGTMDTDGTKFTLNIEI